MSKVMAQATPMLGTPSRFPWYSQENLFPISLLTAFTHRQVLTSLFDLAVAGGVSLRRSVDIDHYSRGVPYSDSIGATSWCRAYCSGPWTCCYFTHCNYLLLRRTQLSVEWSGLPVSNQANTMPTWQRASFFLLSPAKSPNSYHLVQQV